MRVVLHINERFPVKRELIASAKNIDPGQPAQNAQADLGRNFLLLVSFSACQRPILPQDSWKQEDKSESVYDIQDKPETLYKRYKRACANTKVLRRNSSV